MQSKISPRDLALTALFAALTAVGAFIRIPTPWSSFTLQVFFVFLAGVLLGPKYGCLSQVVYVALGLVGLPVFTGGGGPSYIFQTTFGFLLSYIPAAWLVGVLTRRMVTPLRVVLACLAGLGVIYLIGMPYMGLILNLYMGKGMDVWQLLWAGMIPFLPYDALKIGVTVIIAPPLARALNRLRAGSRS